MKDKTKKTTKTTSKKNTKNKYLVEIDPDKLTSKETENHLNQISNLKD